MVSTYDRLTTLAFRLADDIWPGALVQPFLAAPLPPVWIEQVNALNGMGKPNANEPRNPPTAFLDKALYASMPGLLAIARGSWQKPGSAWLYREQDPDERELTTLELAVRLWARRAFQRVGPDLVDEALDRMLAEMPRWDQVGVDPSCYTVRSNGTADPDDRAFRLVPYIIAAEMTKPGVAFEFGVPELHFVRMPLQRQGVELIEWPPREYRGSLYSTLITITVQTVPFQRFPVVHCDLGIRRWISEKAWLPIDRNVSVYLLDRTRGSAAAPACFQQASITRRRVGRDWRWEWDDYLVDLMKAIDPWRAYVNPDDLVRDPRSGFGKDFVAALVYRQDIEWDHDVGPGWMPADRYKLSEQITARLAPRWEPVILPRASDQAGQVAFQKSPFFEKPKEPEEQQEAVAHRCEAVARAAGGRLTVEIRYQQEETRAALLEVIGGFFAIPSLSGEGTWQKPAFALTIHSEPLGDLGRTLELDEGVSRPSERRLVAIRRRAEEIQQQIPSADGAVLSLVEIAGKKMFEGPDDPYNALRLGFARSGRAVQFITLDEKKREHRARAAFLDGLRQIGVLIDLDAAPISSIPQGVNCAGLWLIRRAQTNQRYGRQLLLPVCVLIRPGSREVLATAPGLQPWLSYREALLAIAQAAKTQGSDRKEEVTRFIELVLDSTAGEPLLLTVLTQNFRAAWPWVSNKEITQDSLTLGGVSYPVRKWPRLRIVRVRDSSGHETPQYYASGEKKPYGLTPGLFVMGDRVFGSLTAKPHQMKDLSLELSKVDPWTPRAGKGVDQVRDPRPDAYAWNPNLLELTVACKQKDDDPLAWAGLAHSLRSAAVHYDEAIKLPLPLHLAKLIGQYVVTADEEE